MYYEPEGVFEMDIEEIFNEYDGDASSGSKDADPGDEDATEAEIQAACAEATCELPPTKESYKFDSAPKNNNQKSRGEYDYRPRVLWVVLYEWVDGAPMQIDAAPVTGPWKAIENGQAKQWATDAMAIDWDIEENTEVLVEVVVAPDRETAMYTDGEVEEMWISV